MKKLIYIFINFIAIQCCATNYYLSNNGKDTNSGKSKKQSWQTINRLNKQKLKAGDSVLFKADDKFIGEVMVRYSGNSKAPIVYTVYGNGNAPILSGAIAVNNWQSHQGKILKVAISQPVHNVFVDGEMQVKARYPNAGFLKMDGGFNDKVSFTDNDLTQKGNYWVGATIRFRTWDWEFRTSVVKEYTDRKITIQDSSTNKLDKGWGYYFDNKFSELDTLKEWFYNTADTNLYFIPSVNIATDNLKIEAVIYSTGFSISKGINNIVIKGLKITKYQSYGITAKGNNNHIEIIDNDLENIGLTAVNFDLISKNCLVESNRIDKISGRGVSALEPEQIIIQKNKIINIGSIPGYGINGVNGMIAIAVENVEERKNPSSHIAINNLIKENIIDSIGYVGIRMDGAKSVMEANIISNALLHLSDGAAIYCWALDGDHYTYDNTIKNNIVFNIIGNNLGTPNEEEPIANGIYVDNNAYNILVKDNTVFNSTGSGIHINSGAYNNYISGNTIFNCMAAVSIAEWHKPASTYGNRFENNILYVKDKEQFCISLTNWLVPSTKELGTFNNNTFINLTGNFAFSETYLEKDKTEVSKKYSFENWQKSFGFDKSSKLINSSNSLHNYKSAEIFYNSTSTVNTLNFTKETYYNLMDERIKTLNLNPYTSIILLKK